jgi:hypothetical protein
MPKDDWDSTARGGESTNRRFSTSLDMLLASNHVHTYFEKSTAINEKINDFLLDNDKIKIQMVAAAGVEVVRRLGVAAVWVVAVQTALAAVAAFHKKVVVAWAVVPAYRMPAGHTLAVAVAFLRNPAFGVREVGPCSAAAAVPCPSLEPSHRNPQSFLAGCSIRPLLRVREQECS